MKCFDPVLCFQLDKKRIFRNWSFAKNSTYLRGLSPAFVYNCNKCLYCRKRRSFELAARCVLHASCYLENMFLTLTYDESIDGYHNKKHYPDIQKFNKRLRSHVWRTYKKRIEVFNVHEYGKNGKKHWHLIVFNFSFPDKEVHTYSNSIPLFKSAKLNQLWPHGFSTVGDVSEASAMYQAQYMEKDYKNGNITNDKKSQSRHSGLGKPFFLKHYKQILRLGYVPFSGRKLPLPRYFEKLAHKHWCHYYDQTAFFDTSQRKALYRPFKLGEENRDIADLFQMYKSMKNEKVLELEKEFEETVNEYLGTKQTPTFVKSGANAIYDLNKKNLQERF